MEQEVIYKKKSHSFKRNILAFLAYNLYAITFVAAFQENTAYLFEADLISEMKLSGIVEDPREWGWGSHYIWRLFACVVSTGLAGFIAGAVSKTKGARIAAIANIPSILYWFMMIYLCMTPDFNVQFRTGYIAISVIAIPLSTFIAYKAGEMGEDFQREEYGLDSVLGIKGFHWIWLSSPIYIYSRAIVYVAAKFIGFQFATWADMSIFAAIISILMLLPVVVWFYPLLLVHKILSGELLVDLNGFVKGIANFGILAIGLFVGVGVQTGIYWILNKVLS